MRVNQRWSLCCGFPDADNTCGCQPPDAPALAAIESKTWWSENSARHNKAWHEAKALLPDGSVSEIAKLAQAIFNWGIL